MVKQWSTQELMSYLPHRPPMVWIDQVLDVGQDYRGISGRCRIFLEPHCLFWSESGDLRASAAIEFTAQGYGYLKAAYQEIHQFRDPPAQTYLAGVRYCYANFQGLRHQQVSQLDVSIQVRRQMGPITFIYGEVSLPDSPAEILAKTEVQVYVD